MGNATSAEATALAASIQENLTENPSIPKSTLVDGRFVLTRELFPDHEEAKTLWNVLQWKIKTPRLPKMTPELEPKLPVLTPDRNLLASPPPDEMLVTWLGHATVLVQFDGWNILTDPVFSEDCGPDAVRFLLPRITPAPLQADSLPRIDVVVISHNHYDHLDKQSLQALATLESAPIFFVPLGSKTLLLSFGVANVVEMDWSQKATIPSPPDNSRPPLEITCAPCQHWCTRMLYDRNKSLWGSFFCSTPRGTFYFGGDSGYCGKVFKELGRTFENVSLAAIPIGSYGCEQERSFIKPQHMDPMEAALAHQDLKALKSVAIHWGTFIQTSEPIDEPPEKLEAAKKVLNIPQDNFVVLRHGETRSFDVLRT